MGRFARFGTICTTDTKLRKASHISKYDYFSSGSVYSDTDESKDSMRTERTILGPYYHCHPFTNVQTYHMEFAYEIRALITVHVVTIYCYPVKYVHI